MFGRNRDTSQRTTTAERDVAIDPRARGGVAFGPILTGVVVALGAMFLLSALVGGVLASLGLLDTNVTRGDVVDAGIGAGIVLVVAQFLSYLWGGYTAGRMARGSGVGNGLLVPLTAVVLALLAGGIVAALGATANLNLPFTTNQLPLENGNLVNWGLGIGIASLVAMFLGGALGGGMGARWHSKLEHAHAEAPGDVDRGAPRRDVPAERGDEVDLRESERTPVAAGRPGAAGERADREPPPPADADTRTDRR